MVAGFAECQRTALSPPSSSVRHSLLLLSFLVSSTPPPCVGGSEPPRHENLRATHSDDAAMDDDLGVARRIHNEHKRLERTLRESRRAKILCNVGRAPVHSWQPQAVTALSRIVARANADSNDVVPVRLQHVVQPPMGLTWVRVRTNLRTPEGCKSGYYVPYLGESDAKMLSSTRLAEDLIPLPNDQDDDSSDGDGGADISDVEGIHPTNEAIVNKRIAPFIWNRAVKRVAIKNVVDSIDKNVSALAPIIARELRITHEQVAAYYGNAVHRERQWRKDDQDKLLSEQFWEELADVANARIEDPPGRELTSDSLTKLFCRMCYSFDCMQHGLDDSHPHTDAPDTSRVDSDHVSQAEVMQIQQRCNSGASDHNGPGRCFYATLEPPVQPAQLPQALPQSAMDLVQALRKDMGPDPCRISEMIRIVDSSRSGHVRCRDVGAYLATLPVGRPPLPPIRIMPSKKTRMVVPVGEQKGMHAGLRLDYTPCNHTGACTIKNNCSCAINGINCEKYCTCNHTRISGTERIYHRGICNRAFRGCNCKSAAACQTSQCVCVSYKRECDPDLCRSCGAGQSPDDESRACCNSGLRLGSRFRSIAGRSKVHGWGVFAGEDIPKNSLIGEYLGEVIRQDEAERRGRVYDELNYSFLFNITTEFAIDSTRLGNKLKYCNHSKNPNCQPRLMRVGADVRVGIYSLRDISQFEELFFDYGYTEKTAPSWWNFEAEAAGGSKIDNGSRRASGRGASPGDFAEDDADGEENDADSERDRDSDGEDNNDGMEGGDLAMSRSQPRHRRRLPKRSLGYRQPRVGIVGYIPSGPNSVADGSPGQGNSGK